MILYPCPCCGIVDISRPGSYTICDVCGWEDDPVQSEDPEYQGGANTVSLAEAKRRWEKEKTPLSAELKSEARKRWYEQEHKEKKQLLRPEYYS